MFGHGYSFAIKKSTIYILGKLSPQAVILHFFSPVRLKAGWVTISLKHTCSLETWDNMISTLFSVAWYCWLPDRFDLWCVDCKRQFVNTLVEFCCLVVFYHVLWQKEGHGHSAILFGYDWLSDWLTEQTCLQLSLTKIVDRNYSTLYRESPRLLLKR